MRKAQVDPFLISSAELSAPSLLWDFGKARVDKQRERLRFTVPWQVKIAGLHLHSLPIKVCLIPPQGCGESRAICTSPDGI